MSSEVLLLPILLPLVSGILALAIPEKLSLIREALVLAATAITLCVSAVLFSHNFAFSLPWFGQNFDFSLRLYHFSAFIMLAASGFSFLIAIYSSTFMRGKRSLNQFYSYFLITLALVNGAVLADNLLIFLFFWEGLLLTLFGMIAIGNKNAFKTATKACVIIGISDLCMMAGITLTAVLAKTLTISQINLPLNKLGSLTFILLSIGAISKAGSMPFHTWIPDAADDSSLPFMALVPAALEKLLGIYFLARISLDLFKLDGQSAMSMVLMIVGAITIIFAVMMALIQKDYKRLLSYHAISQVGYMILGIGTAVPIGIVGGLFHMINNAMYKSCLFLTGGAVEKQTGTTDLAKLGGIASKMPITFICFIIAAASISGVPPFNGFFSKELVYDAALKRGMIFYLAAVIGSFLTAASFLKLGHAAYLGKIRPENKNVKEAHFSLLFPMIFIALACVIFGVFNYLPLNKLIQPVLGSRLAGESFAGFPKNTALVIATLVALALALINHLWAVKIKGSGLKAADHIRYAPVLAGIYNKAQERFFDPYVIGLRIVNIISKITYWLDRGIDWIYEKLTVRVVKISSSGLKQLHNGNYSLYLGWCIIGGVVIFAVLMKYFG